jgi:hypothetical protein
MVKLRKEETEDMDFEDLDQAEYSTDEVINYYGDIPPVGITLRGYVHKMWWNRTAIKQDGSGDDPLLKVLWIAADNDGDYEEYNDCPFWLNLALIKSVKFRWGPFFEEYGLSILDIKKQRIFVTGKETQNGFPIEKWGTFKPGEDEDGAWCRIITEQEPYNGVMQARVKSWLPYDEEDEDADEAADEADLDEDEGDEDEGDEDYDEDEEGDEDEDEDEEPDEPPARTRRGSPRTAAAKPATRKAAAKPASRTASKPASARGGTRAKAPAGKARTTATARSGARSGTRAKAGTTTKAATTGRGRGRGSKPAGDDPPF